MDPALILVLGHSDPPVGSPGRYQSEQITYPARVGCMGVKLLIHRLFQRSGIDIDAV